MCEEEFEALGGVAAKKSAMLEKNGPGYFAAAMLAGGYVGFGILLIFTAGGALSPAPSTKIVMGVSFGIALSLVMMAGAELFTGNNMIMTIGMSRKTVSIAQTLKLWVVCFAGNWLGAVALSLVFLGSGLADGATGEFMSHASLAKTSVAPFPLFLRGVLCNVLVCLAVWCSYRCKTEIGKLVMIFWCLYGFITCGFEHCVANMTLLTVGVLAPGGPEVALAGYFYNIFVVTLGNIVGAIVCMTLPYYLMSRKARE